MGTPSHRLQPRGACYDLQRILKAVQKIRGVERIDRYQVG